MKNLIFLLVAFVAAALGACTQNDEPINPVGKFDGIEIVNLADYLGSRAGNDSVIDEPVLRFKDKHSFHTLLSKLQAMTKEEKDCFFEELGFEGAYAIVREAERDLDELFDMDDNDSLAIVAQAKSYILKYKDVLELNKEDNEDLTPYLKFVDDTLALVGSVNGYVVVGNELKEAHKPGPTYDGKFIKFKNAGIGVRNTYKKKKYRSEIVAGRKGSKMAFFVRTYRNKLFYKSVLKHTGHDGILEYINGNKHCKVRVHHYEGDYPIGADAIDYTPIFKMKVTDFCCTLNSNNKVTKEIERIKMK